MNDLIQNIEARSNSNFYFILFFLFYKTILNFFMLFLSLYKLFFLFFLQKDDKQNGDSHFGVQNMISKIC